MTTTNIILAILALGGFAAAIAEAAINHRLKREKESLRDEVLLYLETLTFVKGFYIVSDSGSVISVGRNHTRETNGSTDKAVCIVWEQPYTDENHDYILRCAQEVCDKLNEKP